MSLTLFMMQGKAYDTTENGSGLTCERERNKCTLDERKKL